MGKKSYDERNFKFETLQLHVGQEQPDPVTDARAVPIYQTSSYVFRNCEHAAARFGLTDAGNIYGRLTNPTEDVFEKRIAALEGGVAALATASGAAAITYTIEALAADGGHIVAQKTIYGGSYNLLEHTLSHFGVSTTFVDAHNLQEVEDAIQENTKAIYIENKDKRVFRDVHLAYLSWQDILLGLDQVLISSSYEKKMIEDLKTLLREKGFVSFEGFSIDQPVVDKDICWTMDGNDFVKSDA